MRPVCGNLARFVYGSRTTHAGDNGEAAESHVWLARLARLLAATGRIESRGSGRHPNVAL
jgi:hypothetical protein